MTYKPGWRSLYRVTDNGRVFSTGHNWRGYGEHELTQHLNSYGYPSVRLTINGTRQRCTVHRLVADAYLPPQPSPDHEIRHLDGNKTNNNANNLAWGTKSDNALDRGRHGSQYRPPWHDPEYRRRQSLAISKGRRAAIAKARGE